MVYTRMTLLVLCTAVIYSTVEVCCVVSRKLPHGVHKDDFARPLYRRDIFYSGSLLHVEQFHSAPDVHKYVKSVTSVPGSIEPERTYRLCHCIPISKASYDTLTQVSYTHNGSVTLTTS